MDVNMHDEYKLGQDRKGSSAYLNQRKGYTEFKRRKTVDEELAEVICGKGEAIDKVVLKYTLASMDSQSKPPVDKMKQLNKIRPVTLPIDRKIEPIESFQDAITQKRIAKVYED